MLSLSLLLVTFIELLTSTPLVSPFLFESFLNLSFELSRQSSSFLYPVMSCLQRDPLIVMFAQTYNPATSHGKPFCHILFNRRNITPCMTNNAMQTTTQKTMINHQPQYV